MGLFGLGGWEGYPRSTTESLGNPNADIPHMDPTLSSRPFDDKADIYSLGVTLGECLTGKNADYLRNGVQISLDGHKLLTKEQDHINAVTRLISCMTHPDPNLRPSAALIENYCDICFTGGYLPNLPCEEQVEIPQSGSMDGIWTPIVIGLGVIAAIGIGAAILGGGDGSKRKG